MCAVTVNGENFEFTRFTEDVHSTVIVDSVASNGVHLVPTSPIEWVPCKQPVILIVCVNEMDVQLQLGLI